MDDDDTEAVQAESQTPGDAKADAQTFEKSALLDRIVAGTGLPKPQVRRVLDAALIEIGVALDSGATLSLPPFGKLRSVRQADKGGTSVHTLKLRRSPAKDAASNDANAPKPSAGAQARARVKRDSSARHVAGHADPAPAAPPKGKPAGDQRANGKHPKQARSKSSPGSATPRASGQPAAEKAHDSTSPKS